MLKNYGDNFCNEQRKISLLRSKQNCNLYTDLFNLFLFLTYLFVTSSQSPAKEGEMANNRKLATVFFKYSVKKFVCFFLIKKNEELII